MDNIINMADDDKTGTQGSQDPGNKPGRDGDKDDNNE